MTEARADPPDADHGRHSHRDVLLLDVSKTLARRRSHCRVAWKAQARATVSSLALRDECASGGTIDVPPLASPWRRIGRGLSHDRGDRGQWAAEMRFGRLDARRLGSLQIAKGDG